MNSAVFNIASYEDHEGINRVVKEALCFDSEIEKVLRRSEESTLVVLKPNWVQESHEYDPDIWIPLITHPNLVISVIKSLATMMNGKGTIVVCDAPHTYANFQKILERGSFTTEFGEIKRKWPSIKFEIIDLRREIWTRKEEVVTDRRPNAEDPRGYVKVNLGENSHFYNYEGEGSYYGADYDSHVVNEHHNGKTQEYMLAGTPMHCDLFINLPKVKTHKKTGVTCCLKNLVGINGDKNWLPHHTQGSKTFVGDEFPRASMTSRIESSLKDVGKQIALNVPFLGSYVYRKMRVAGKKIIGDSEKVIRNGNWSGNDTCWRMALDLNRAFLYGNGQGLLEGKPVRRKYLAIVDGIVGGEGNGPLCPNPVNSNVLVYGTNPAVVDAVVAKLMGFNIHYLPIIENAFNESSFPISDTVLSNIMINDFRSNVSVGIKELLPATTTGFQPHFGWKQLNNLRDGQC
jgi:uncharacterized protein (DUF362 family)